MYRETHALGADFMFLARKLQQHVMHKIDSCVCCHSHECASYWKTYASHMLHKADDAVHTVHTGVLMAL